MQQTLNTMGNFNNTTHDFPEVGSTHYFCRLTEDGWEPHWDEWIGHEEQKRRLYEDKIFPSKTECQVKCDQLNLLLYGPKELRHYDPYF